jgi:hypothetical protein
MGIGLWQEACLEYSIPRGDIEKIIKMIEKNIHRIDTLYDEILYMEVNYEIYWREGILGGKV